MDFQISENRVFLEGEDGKLLAEITFPQTGDNLFCIDHTFVDSSLRGQGVAGKLVEKAVEVISSRGGQVTATCSYAQKWLSEHA